MTEIKIHYGPYQKFGIIRHRPQRLHGAIKRLEELGYKIELVPSQYIDRVSIEMKGKRIFQCDMKQLLFNIDSDNDPVCQKLIEAVEEAKKWIYSTTNTFSSFKNNVPLKNSEETSQRDNTLLSSDILISFELESADECLTKLEYEIEIIPSIHINRLTIEMLGREVFCCNIKNLLFNMDCEDDPVCKRAVEAVQEAASRLYDDDNIPSFYPVSKGKRIVQDIKNIKVTQDLLSTDLKIWFEIPRNSRVDLQEIMSKCDENDENLEN